MGLNLYYDFDAETRCPQRARLLIEKLHRFARTLAFQQVGDVVELTGDSTDYDKCSTSDPIRPLLIQTRRVVVGEGRNYGVTPDHLFGFLVCPGDGCEVAGFGLALYPTTIEVEGETIPTKFGSWVWASSSETEYASDPEFGGMKHFLRCHLSLVKLLDHAAKLGITVDAEDETYFWTKRDVKELVAEMARWDSTQATRWREELSPKACDEIAKFFSFEADNRTGGAELAVNANPTS